MNSISLSSLRYLWGSAGAPEKFQEMCSLLVKSEHPNAAGVRVQRGDGGVDTFAGPWAEDGDVTVYQMKYFPDGIGDSQKDQIRQSYTTARNNANFCLTTWVLCIPVA